MNPPILLPLGALRPSKTNPRKIFDEEKLRELAADLPKGFLQALIVRPMWCLGCATQAQLDAKRPATPWEGSYEIVDGERRYRASGAKYADIAEVRVERLRGLLRFIFYFGPQPEGVVRRVFCLAKWRPLTAALMLDMSLACLGVMFGETRATWSWRVKQVINRFLSAHHVRGTHSGFQRSEEACDHYAAAQRNNQNRRGGVPKVA